MPECVGVTKRLEQISLKFELTQNAGPVQESNIKYCTVVQPCGQAILVAVPEQVLPAAAIISAETAQSPQRYPHMCPPTAIQLSLLASERQLAATAQSQGHYQGSEEMSEGSPESVAASPAASREVAGDSPAAPSRPVIQIHVDATYSHLPSSYVAAALAHWNANAGSQPSTPVQVPFSWSAAEQETGAETGSASSQPVVCKEAWAGSAVIRSAAESTVGDSGEAEAVVEDLDCEAAGQEDSSAVVIEASAESVSKNDRKTPGKVSD